MAVARRRLTRWLIGTAIALAVLVALLAAGYGILQTAPGRDAVASLIENVLSEPGASQVKISDLTGTLPHRVRAKGISISDADGVWLEVVDLAIDWRPLALFGGRAEVDSVSAGSIRVSRQPKGPAGSDAKAEGSFSLPLAGRVGRLLVDRLQLDEPVVGAAAAVRLFASLAARDDEAVHTNLTLERIDGVKGTVRADVTFNTRARTLIVNASAREPVGGLLARLLELPGLPAVKVAVRGDGPVSDWRGRLAAEADGLAAVGSALTISGTGPYTLQAVGTADIARAMQPPFRTFVSSIVSFDIAADWAPGADSIRVKRVRLSSDAATVEAQGDLMTKTLVVEGKATVEVVKPALLRPHIAPFDAERVSASVELAGALRQPKVRGSIRLGGLRGPVVKIGHGEISLTAVPDAKAAKALWAVDGDARFRNVSFDEPALDAVFGDSLSARLSGNIDAIKGTVQNARLEATGVNGSVRATGHADAVAAEGGAKLSVAVPDLTPLSRLAAVKIAGSLGLDADVTFGPSGATARITGGPTGLKIADPVAAALLGPKPMVTGTVVAKPDGVVAMSDMTVQGTALILEVPSLTSDGRQVNATYNAAIRDLVPVAKALEVSAGGSVKATGTVTGPISTISTKGVLDASSVRWNKRALGSAKATYAITAAKSKIDGTISVSASTNAGKLDLGAKVVMPGADMVQLTELSLKGAGTEIGGRLSVPTTGRPIVGALKGRIGDLAPWSSMLDVPLEGAADIDLRLAPDKGRQAARLTVKGRNISYDREVTLAALTGEASAVVAKKGVRGTWRFTARDVRSAIGALKTATVSGTGDPSDVVAKFSVKGDLHGALDVSGEARVAARGDGLRVTLRKLTGVAAGQPISLNQPAIYAARPEIVDVSLPKLSWAKGTVSLSGRLDSKSVSARATVKRLPVSTIAGLLAGFEGSGTIDIAASLAGTPAAPSGDLQMTVSDLKMNGGGTEHLAPLSGKVISKLRNGRMKVTANIAGLGDTGLKAEANLPVRISAAPVSVAVPPDGSIDGMVSWRGDILALGPLLPLDEHKVSGALAVSARADGTVGRPRLRGEVTWTDGRYENFETGTVLQGIKLRAEADEDRIDLKQMSANDGGKGRLTGEGSILLGKSAGPRVDIGVTMKSLSVVRRDDVTAVASGTVRAKGTSERLTLSGRIETDQVDITIIDTLPPGVVDLEVVEVNAPGDAGRKAANRPPAAATSSIVLALRVEMPRRVYLRGRGLDSEWKGRLDVSGDTAAPVIKGQLKPVRGQFDLAGKTFKLNDGQVTFDGGKKIDPILEVPLEYKANGLTAIVQIKGTASKPKIELTSVPTLPQDEILAKILFNKETGQLSPTEVVQLGAAVASLTGLDGGGLGFLDNVRQALGLDALRVGEDDNGDTTVGVGKYVTDGVFVGVDSGAAQKSGNVSVEVTINPNVSVKTDVGADDRSRVGVNWKLDY